MAGEITPASAGASAAQVVANSNPYLAWINAGSNALQALKPAPAGPSRADSGGVSAGNNEGWTVATGGSTATGSRTPWLELAGLAVGIVGLILAWKTLKRT